MTSHLRKLVSVLSLVTLALAAGCGAQNASGEPTSEAPQTAEQGVAGEQGQAHHRGPGGPEMLLFAALHELDLTAEQKTTLQAALEKVKAHHPQGAKNPMAALAAGVRAGKIDTTLPQPPPDAEEHRAVVADALDTLHKTLSREQRRSLVDGIEKKMAEHGPPEHRGPKHDKGERHGEPGAEGHGHRGPMGPLGGMLRDLELTEQQHAAIKQALEAQRPSAPDRDAMQKRHEAMVTAMRARLESFASDSFDAKAFTSPPEGADRHHPAEHMLKTLAVVVPILEPAQREKLAANLEKGPPGPGRRGHHPRHLRPPCDALSSLSSCSPSARRSSPLAPRSSPRSSPSSPTPRSRPRTPSRRRIRSRRRTRPPRATRRRRRRRRSPRSRSRRCCRRTCRR